MGIRRMIGRTTLVVAALAVTAPLAACGPVLLAGPRATQERDIAGVSALDLRTSGDLTVTVGETESLTITAASNVISSLTAEVDDGTLVLDSDLGALGPTLIRYELTVRSLDRVRITGSGRRVRRRRIRPDGHDRDPRLGQCDAHGSRDRRPDRDGRGLGRRHRRRSERVAAADPGRVGRRRRRRPAHEDRERFAQGKRRRPRARQRRPRRHRERQQRTRLHGRPPAQITRGTSGSGEIAAG